jgi:hypothetical protein
VQRRYRFYQHGTTVHGRQSVDPHSRAYPLSYYHLTGPLGQTLGALDLRGGVRRVAVLGLGIGSAAAYSRPGQHWTFYEIDPVVESIARDARYFTYLQGAHGRCDVVLGDGRLALAATDPQTRYDLIVVDVFSSDAIPVHLYTREAFELYLGRLAPDGVLAVHITNRFLQFRPVLAAIAAELGLAGLAQWERTVSLQEQAEGKLPSHWAVLARTQASFGRLASDPRWQPLEPQPGVRPWTDDYSDILGLIRWED